MGNMIQDIESKIGEKIKEVEDTKILLEKALSCINEICSLEVERNREYANGFPNALKEDKEVARKPTSLFLNPALYEKIKLQARKENKHIYEYVEQALEREMLCSNSKEIKAVGVKNPKNTVVKTVRIYAEVKKELDKFLKANRHFKVTDIISSAIMEYINKHS